MTLVHSKAIHPQGQTGSCRVSEAQIEHVRSDPTSAARTDAERARGGQLSRVRMCLGSRGGVRYDGADPSWDMLVAPFTSCVSYVRDLSPLNYGDQARYSFEI